MDRGLGSVKSFTLGTWEGSRSSPVLKQLFAWMFRDHAQDQAPGIRKLQSMPGRSPAEVTVVVLERLTAIREAVWCQIGGFQFQLCGLKLFSKIISLN